MEECLRSLFPTVWSGETTAEVSGQVSLSELDLVILESDATVSIDKWLSHHLICFSEVMSQLPGPKPWSHCSNIGSTQREEFLLPDLPIPLHKARQRNLELVSSTRGWIKLAAQIPRGLPQEETSEARAIFDAGTLLRTAENSNPLAVCYVRPQSNRGIAWLPNQAFNRLDWITVLTNLWAEVDPESFPSLGNWARSKTWMLSAERVLTEKIAALEQEKIEALRGFDSQISQVTQDLEVLSHEIDRSRRRLISEQGDALVEEVALVLEEIGFQVEGVDETLPEGAAKREDLRLRDPSLGSNWEAIVEVRGYKKSAGTTADLQRLYRFAVFYRQQKNREPDMKLYIVNPQIELPPDQREKPLRSAGEDVQAFAEGDGLVISTLDLFQALRNTPDLTKIRRSIVESRGRWDFPPQKVVSQEEEKSS